MSDSASDISHTGGCICGAVRFTTIGKPLRTGLCHCFDCRKAHAAPFAAFVVFAAKSVSFTDRAGGVLGDDALGAYDNGHGYKRHFCRACGSRIWGADSDDSDVELHIGLFDEANLWTPTYECWVTRRERWVGDMPTVFSSYEEDRPNPHNLPG